jgi:hypothetical protein
MVTPSGYGRALLATSGGIYQTLCVTEGCEVRIGLSAGERRFKLSDSPKSLTVNQVGFANAPRWYTLHAQWTAASVPTHPGPGAFPRHNHADRIRR